MSEVFRIQVFKNLIAAPTRSWTNVYHVSADDLPTAASGATIVADFERTYHMSIVTISHALTSTQVEGDTSFIETIIDAPGTLTEDDYLPLYNTVRFDIEKDSFGRPDRKYYRFPLKEAFQVKGVIDETYAANLETAFNAMLLDMVGNATPLIGFPSGNWVAGNVNRAVQMRQLHRKRRHVTP